MLHFKGDQDFAQPLPVVWSRLSDIKFLVGCIPDAEAVEHPSPQRATCKVRPGFTFVRGTLGVTLEIVEAVEGQALKLLCHAKGIGSGNDVEMALTFAEREGGSRVHWSADVTNLTGLLKAAPRMLLQGAAQKVIADVWESVKRNLANG